MYAGLSKLENIRIAGLLHDIGKINVPIEILTKPGKINNDEFKIIKAHPRIGYEMLKDMDFQNEITLSILQHHERISGGGYPLGLSGKEILIEAKIMAVADVVEAMSSHRPYRPSIGIKTALEEIMKNSGILYDAEVVKVCLSLFQDEKFTFDAHVM